MRAFGWLKKLRKNERGNALVIGAATLPLIIGAAAIGVDTIQVSLAKRQLQRTADSAALAGAYALVQGQTPANSVNHDLALNNDVTVASTTIEHAPTAGPYAGNMLAVRVILTATRRVPFMQFFDRGAMTVRAEATGAIIWAGEFCMVSLETGNVTGVTFSGNTTVDLGCGVATNSRSANGITADGSARVLATPIAAVGGVPSSSAYQTGTVLLPYSPPQADPFAGLPRPPTPPSDCVPLNLNPQGNTAVTFPPLGLSKSYCIVGSTTGQNAAKIQSDIALPSATYYIQGGVLDFGPATVTERPPATSTSPTGVTFVLTTPPNSTTGVATLSMNANTVLRLSAPDTGTYAGVLMYQDPRSTGGINRINGNAGAHLQGAFYFPSSDLVFNGSSNLTLTCLQLVALHLSFSGNSNIRNNCPANSGSDSFDATMVRLVG